MPALTWPDTRLCDLLGIDHPIIQAPMAGATTPAMAAAAANAGALGSLGCAMLTPDVYRAEAAAARAGTDRSLNMNFFVHAPPVVDADRLARARERLVDAYAELGLGDVPQVAPTGEPFTEAMLEAVLEAPPRVVSFHFGLPGERLLQPLRDAGVVILSSATSADEARWLVERGVDAVIAQGAEAGGHSGWFLPRRGDIAGLMALVPRVVDAVAVPVIAAGGIADGRGIAAAFCLGAAGVQIGSAFLATPESAISQVHKDAVLAATGDDTTATIAFSGRSARGVANRYTREMTGIDDWPDFPLVNALTAPLRAASAAMGSPDYVALWAGQGAGLVTASTTTEVIERLVREALAVLGRR